MKPSELFCVKDARNFATLLFYLEACKKKFQRANATDIAQDGKDPPNGLARDSQTRTRLVDSLICTTCSLENNVFSVLHYVMVTLHYSTLHRFEIFSTPGTFAHGSIRLPPRNLASSRGCSLAINNSIRIQASLILIPKRRNTDTEGVIESVCINEVSVLTL